MLNDKVPRNAQKSMNREIKHKPILAHGIGCLCQVSSKSDQNSKGKSEKTLPLTLHGKVQKCPKIKKVKKTPGDIDKRHVLVKFQGSSANLCEINGSLRRRRTTDDKAI